MGTSSTDGRGGWWSRIGTAGQVLTALIGLAAAVVPLMVTKGVPGLGSPGTRLDVYTHQEAGGGVSLSLESAGES